MSQLARIVKLKRGCVNKANICIGDIVHVERVSIYSTECVYTVWPVLTQNMWDVSAAILSESELEVIE